MMSEKDGEGEIFYLYRSFVVESHPQSQMFPHLALILPYASHTILTTKYLA